MSVYNLLKSSNAILFGGNGYVATVKVGSNANYQYAKSLDGFYSWKDIYRMDHKSLSSDNPLLLKPGIYEVYISDSVYLGFFMHEGRLVALDLIHDVIGIEIVSNHSSSYLDNSHVKYLIPGDVKVGTPHPYKDGSEGNVRGSIRLTTKTVTEVSFINGSNNGHGWELAIINGLKYYFYLQGEWIFLDEDELEGKSIGNEFEFDSIPVLDTYNKFDKVLVG